MSEKVRRRQCLEKLGSRGVKDSSKVFDDSNHFFPSLVIKYRNVFSYVSGDVDIVLEFHEQYNWQKL